MRKHLPWLLILLAVGLGYLLLVDGDEQREVDYEADRVGVDAPGPDMAPGSLKGASGATKNGGARTKPKRAWQPPDPRTLPRGVLIVKPRGPDLKPLIARGLTMIVTPRGQRAAKLGLFDEETGDWRFERVIAGTVDIKVTGDHIIGRTTKAVVKRDAETTFELHLELAGALRYDVMTYAKTRPGPLVVELFDATGRPAEGWFQERATRKLTQPRKVKSLTMGPEGIVFGIAPGDYRLKVTHIETDEWDDAEVTVEAGKTEMLKLEVRR